MDLMWIEGELLVAGPDTRAHVGAAELGTRHAAIRFAPGTGPGFLGVPADELRDIRVPLADVWSPGRSRRLADRVGMAANPAGALEEAVAQLSDVPVDPLAGRVTAGARRGESISTIAEATGLSERQLHRRCLAAFGYGPKMLTRVLRMNAALDRARLGQSLAEVATATGYADQAHLTREVKALAGVSPRVLLT